MNADFSRPFSVVAGDVWIAMSGYPLRVLGTVRAGSFLEAHALAEVMWPTHDCCVIPYVHCSDARQLQALGIEHARAQGSACHEIAQNERVAGERLAEGRCSVSTTDARRMRSTLFWTTREGERIRIKDMTDSHLVATLRMLERWHERLVFRDTMMMACPMFAPGGDGAQAALDQAEAELLDMDAEDRWPVYGALAQEAHARGLSWAS